MNYYEALGVSNSASTQEIQKAFRTMAKRYHPDTYQGSHESEIKRNQAQFILITQAYETLKDAQKRKAYDAKLNLHSQKNQTNNSFDQKQEDHHFTGFEQNSHPFEDFEANNFTFTHQDLSDLFQDADNLLNKLGVDPRPKFEQLLDWALAVFNRFLQDEETTNHFQNDSHHSSHHKYQDDIHQEFENLKRKYS